MKQVWDYAAWRDIPLGRAREAILERAAQAPELGELSVRELMGQSLAGDTAPVGIYVFTRGTEEVVYLGKTHGRSLAERTICHLDSREMAPDGVHVVTQGDTWEGIARAWGTTQTKIKKYNKGKSLDPGVALKTTNNWSMSSLVAKMVSMKLASNRVDAVARVMDYRIIWMRVPKPEAAPARHQEHVEVIEKRLLWDKAAPPILNSRRGNDGIRFGVEGLGHTRSADMGIGCEAYLKA